MVVLALNWKMAPDKAKDALSLAKKTLALAGKHKKKLSIIVFPPFVHIPIVSKLSKRLLVGGQSVGAAPLVAQTGIISAGMLSGVGASHCIVGHSEARARGESNDIVAQQVVRLVEKKITPVLCVGEKERDHQGWYLSEVKDQVMSVLHLLPRAVVKKLIIAYEPVWAIGSDANREATAAECRAMIVYIRKLVSDACDPKTGDSIRVLYGGSVHEKNAQSFITDGGADGLLVGRVSHDTKRLAALAEALVV